VTPGAADELRAVFERARRSDRASAVRLAPAGWAETFERLVEGPDPAGALSRAGSLPASCLERPFSPALCTLLHQGGYPARLLALCPDALAVLEEPAPQPGPVLPRLRALADRMPLALAIATVRTHEYLRLARREVQGAGLEEVGGELSRLVAACAQVALERTDPELASLIAVVGMGKLGGDELNFLSDIDLVFLHSDAIGDEGQGPTPGRARVFDRLRRVVALLEGEGPWRPLFRVDLRLRPFGSRGPLSLSLSATESYYERHGRTWERQVWIRAQPLAGDLSLAAALIERLAPFVWRRALAATVFDEIAALMRRARRASHRSALAGGVDLKHDAGGIREIEFFVQALQLLNGGRRIGLRARPTLVALDRLLAEGLLSGREHERLAEAYRWLRRVEHRIQLAEGAQTHAIPDEAGERARLAGRLWPERSPAAACARLDADLTRHREEVMAIAQTLHAPDEIARLPGERARARAREAVVDPGAPAALRTRALASLGVRDPGDAAALLQHLRTRRDGAFASPGRAGEGADRLLLACLDSADPDAALRRLAEFADSRPAHFGAWRLLAEPDRIELVRLLAEVLASSEPLGRGLIGFPDEHTPDRDDSLALVLDASATALPDARDAAAELAAWAHGHPDPASAPELDRALLRFKLRQLVRIGLFDLGRRPDPLTVGASLSDLTDLVLRVLLRDCARAFAEGEIGGEVQRRFDLLVLAAGKYGMRAMDYGSDLDLVFVFDPQGDDAPEVRDAAIRVARHLIARLEARTFGARLYEADTRLRPSGRQGLLVSSLEAWRHYHAGPLPVWERLALLRARAVAEIRVGPECTGPGAALPVARPGPLAAVVLGEVLGPSLSRTPRPDLGLVSREVRTLKRRIEAEIARETRDVLDPKSGHGGSLELELLVGALELVDGPLPPPLEIPRALERLADAGRIAPERAAALAAAYRFTRLLLNRLRMSSGGGSDDGDRFAVNSPRLTPIARRMGLADAQALISTYLEQRARVREAFDHHLPAP
jgi:glutamate-ammonia-ligase adenylyltransferase